MKEWFYNNWQLDLAVETVSYKNNDPANGADITIANLQKMAMPATVEVVFKDSSKQRFQLPVETWMQAAVHAVHLATTQKIRAVIIDPDNRLPDSNRKNNSIVF